MPSILITILLVVGLCATAVGQTWKLIPTPATSKLPRVVVLPNNVLAFAHITGIDVRINKFAPWQRTLTTYNILDLQGADKLYASGGEGSAFLYKSDFLGSNWTNIARDSIAKPYVTRLAIRSPEYLLAQGSKFGGDEPWLYGSTDEGASWGSVSSAPPPYFWGMVADTGSSVYGYNAVWGFYRSTDNGATWTSSISGITTTTFNGLAMNHLGHLFIPSSNGKIFRSIDKGRSWQSATGAFSDSIDLKSIAIAASGEIYVYAKSATQSTVEVSINDGITWNQVGESITWRNVLDEVSCMAATPSGGVVILYGDDLYTNDVSITTDVQPAPSTTPSSFLLHQNSPNPFNPVTTLRYDVIRLGHVCVTVFDLFGRVVSTLVDEVQPPGTYAVVWNGDGHPSGVYFYRMVAGDFTQTKKMVLMK